MRTNPIADHIDGDVDWAKFRAILVFMVPGLTLFALFSVGPMVYSAVGSFYVWDGFTAQHFAGIETWISTLQDDAIINWSNLLSLTYPMGALPQNLIWMVIHVPLSTFLGLGLALLFSDLRGRRILRSMVFLAFTTPTVVIGLVLLFVYDPQAGIFNEFLRQVSLDGLVRNWVQQPQIAIYALIAGGVWVQTGFSMLLYSSALAGIDPALLESARIDGAGPFRRFKDVIWPLVKPVTAIVVIMSMIWVIRIFAIVFAAGGPSGGPNGVFSVLGLEVYQAAFSIPIEYSKAMVVSLLELIIALPMAWYIARMD